MSNMIRRGDKLDVRAERNNDALVWRAASDAVPILATGSDTLETPAHKQRSSSRNFIRWFFPVKAAELL